MKVEYKGHKILRGLDGVDMRHLRPAAIITGKHEEKQLIDKVIAKSGYVGCVFDDDDGVHGIRRLEGELQATSAKYREMANMMAYWRSRCIAYEKMLVERSRKAGAEK